MRAVIQRVSNASVRVNSGLIACINKGLLVLIGLHSHDGSDDMDYIIKKILQLRVFDDKNGIMNLSVSDVNGEILLVSQFTLYGNAHKGNRPSYTEAMKPELAADFFEALMDRFKSVFPGIKSGQFGAHMDVELINSGPVTILVDSKKKF